MDSIRYQWRGGERAYTYAFALVRGTRGEPYEFGEPGELRSIDVSDFMIGTVPVTQAFWRHVMGDATNPAINRGDDLPVENVSWDVITKDGGLLSELNAGPVGDAIRGAQHASSVFRLPTETEWEYAARGGTHWRDRFRYSGSNEVDAVAWYDRRHGDHTQRVAQKSSNQLGLYDMSGNVWEWCADAYTPSVSSIPSDGSALVAASNERVLRGGCFHNWAMHCTVSKRYQIGREFYDGCIGVRLVLAIPS